MKKNILGITIVFVFFAGCARTWMYHPIETYKPAGTTPPASVCATCHQAQHDSWRANRHGSESKMGIIPVNELRECGACHAGIAEHAADPSAKAPQSIAKMNKTEQNNVCGKCHYNQQIFAGRAINPHDRHALYKNVGFEGREQQLSCLDCHSGHQGRSEMLVRAKAHICYKCHKGAIATMAIFQPFSYLTFGKACQACHSIHGGSSAAQYARMGVGVCVICHFGGTAIVD